MNELKYTLATSTLAGILGGIIGHHFGHTNGVNDGVHKARKDYEPIRITIYCERTPTPTPDEIIVHVQNGKNYIFVRKNGETYELAGDGTKRETIDTTLRYNEGSN